MIGRNVTIEVATTDLSSLRGTGDDVGRVSELCRDRQYDSAGEMVGGIVRSDLEHARRSSPQDRVSDEEAIASTDA